MRTNWFFAVAVVVLGLVTGIAAPAQAASASVSTTLHASDGSEVGGAKFTEIPSGVEVLISISNLPAGAHGFHIHAKGKCEPPGFKSAGGHFNPEGKKHGLKSPQGHHLGDLPNLVVGADGRGDLKVVVKGVTLGSGENSLLRTGGTALVIHASSDDERTDPSGNAGARIACGVIQPAGK